MILVSWFILALLFLVALCSVTGVILLILIHWPSGESVQ
jgi:hypothetical protein